MSAPHTHTHTAPASPTLEYSHDHLEAENCEPLDGKKRKYEEATSVEKYELYLYHQQNPKLKQVSSIIHLIAPNGESQIYLILTSVSSANSPSGSATASTAKSTSQPFPETSRSSKFSRLLPQVRSMRWPLVNGSGSRSPPQPHLRHTNLFITARTTVATHLPPPMDSGLQLPLHGMSAALLTGNCTISSFKFAGITMRRRSTSTSN